MSIRVCSICEGPAGLLGQLGRLKHYQCRNCGMQFSEPVYDDGVTCGDCGNHLDDCTCLVGEV